MAIPNEPLTRGEQYLAKAAGEDVTLPDAPLTRMEQYLAKIAGQDVETPDAPLSRMEQYLDYIAENGGSGGDITLETLTVSQNGTTNAPSGKAYNKVIAAVPNSYSAGDEGKVVSGGALVSQTAHAEVTANGTIDTTLNNSVTVNVPTGGGTRTPVKLGEYTITEPIRTLEITLTQEMRELDKLWVFSTSPITKDQSDYLYFGLGSAYSGYFASATSNSLTGMLFNVQAADLGNKHYNAQSFMVVSGVTTIARSTEGSVATKLSIYNYKAGSSLTGGTIEIWG